MPDSSPDRDPRRIELDVRAAQLRDRIERVHLHRLLNAPLEDAYAESLSERANQPVLDELETSLAEQLQQVKRARQRIAEGWGDYCEHCGERIGSDRLKALPYATSCLLCASH
jgi:DnaK suppressor protein